MHLLIRLHPRDEIAGCSEKAYDSLSIRDAQQMLLFPSDSELLKYITEVFLFLVFHLNSPTCQKGKKWYFFTIFNDIWTKIQLCISHAQLVGFSTIILWAFFGFLFIAGLALVCLLSWFESYSAEVILEEHFDTFEIFFYTDIY